MPIAPLLPAIIAGVSALGSTVASAISTRRQNKAAQQYADKAYHRERTDALSDWERVNAYNSPQAQMQRFQEAGLNPNLIYGQQNTAAPVHPADVQRGQFETPDFSGIAQAGNFLGDAMDYEIKQAQLANLQAQNTVIFEEALLKQATREQLGVTTERGRFDLGLETELRDISADYRRENLRALRQQMDLSINADERAAAQNTSSLREAAERILNMRVQRQHLQADLPRIRAEIDRLNLGNQLQRMEIDLRRNGITSSDPIYWRILGRMLQDVDLTEGARDLLKN